MPVWLVMSSSQRTYFNISKIFLQLVDTKTAHLKLSYLHPLSNDVCPAQLVGRDQCINQTNLKLMYKSVLNKIKLFRLTIIKFDNNIKPKKINPKICDTLSAS